MCPRIIYFCTAVSHPPHLRPNAHTPSTLRASLAFPCSPSWRYNRTTVAAKKIRRRLWPLGTKAPPHRWCPCRRSQFAPVLPKGSARATSQARRAWRAPKLPPRLVQVYNVSHGCSTSLPLPQAVMDRHGQQDLSRSSGQYSRSFQTHLVPQSQFLFLHFILVLMLPLPPPAPQF
jgi:hypothetical protein